MKAVIRKLIVFACLVAFTTKASAQLVSYQQKAVPDTLTFAERFSISTNAFDWLILLPNISVEYDIRPEEWNKWAVGFKLRGNWKTWNKEGFKPAQVYNLIEGRFEVRNYFRTRIVNAENAKYFPKPEGFFKKLLTNRRDSVVKHPNLTYYRGGYVSFSKYSFRLFSATGHQGIAAQAGVLFGIVRPLYQFANGNSMDLDLGISGGVCFTKADEYGYDRENNCYPIQKRNGWQIVPYPVINEARVAFVYRFGDGSNMITHKYRDRYDVDEAYRTAHQNRIDSLLDAQARQAAEDKVINALYHQFDSVYNMVYQNKLNEYQRQEAEKKAAEKAAQEAIVKHKKDSIAAIATAAKNAKLAAKLAEKNAKDSVAAAQKAMKDSISAAQKSAKHAQDSIARAAKDSISAAKDSISAAKKALKHQPGAAVTDSISSDAATVDSASAESPVVPESVPAASDTESEATPDTESEVTPDADSEATPAAEDTPAPTYEEVPAEEATPAESDTPAESTVPEASPEGSGSDTPSENDNTPEEKEAEE